MAPISRLEINFRRLLEKCESMAAEHREEDSSSGNWRFEKFVEALEERLAELKKVASSHPSKETLAEYTKRVEFLKGMLATSKLPSVTEKAVASQLLSPGPSPNINTKTKEIQLQNQARYTQEMRKELLGSRSPSVTESSGLRKRQLNSSEGTTTEDLDALLRHHNSMQEKIAEEMVSLARNLKQNSLLAGHIIRKDIETLEKSSQLSDQNYDRLKVESDRLQTHVNQSCNWWLWILLAVVCIVFLWMIFFIRLFSKK